MGSRLLHFFGGNNKYLLDSYPNAIVGFSLRKLRGGYNGSCIRVRRSSDNSELNIGFVNDELDTASLLSFCGANNGFISLWYDQSINSNNATQTTILSQPQIVASGSIINVNTKSAITFDGTNDFLNLTTTINPASSSYNTFVGKRDLASRRMFGLSGRQSSSAYLFGLWSDNKYYLQANSTNYQTSNAVDNSTAQLLLTGANSSGSMSIYKNNNLVPSSQITTPIILTLNAIGAYGISSIVANCSIQEIVFYNDNQLANRAGIETNINSYYNIF